MIYIIRSDIIFSCFCPNSGKIDILYLIEMSNDSKHFSSDSPIRAARKIDILPKREKRGEAGKKRRSR